MPDYSIPVYPRSAGFDHTPVDAFGALSLAMDTSGWPQLIAGHSTFRGDCDPEAFAHCIETVAASRPVFNSYLAGIGPRQNQKLVWRHQSRPFRAEIRDLSSPPGPAPGGDFDDWLSEHRLGDSTQMKIGSNEGHMTKSELKQFHALVVAKIEAYAD